MKKSILRLQVCLNGVACFNVPKGSTFKHFGYQPVRDQFSAWYECPVDAAPDDPDHHQAYIVNTGDTYDGVHLGSLMMPDGYTMYHLVEVPK